MRSLILAAPASGSGKTTITLGLLRALKQASLGIRSAKSGPDYIDPQFHAAATGRPCVNLDPWAMTPDRLRRLAAGPDDLIIEGAMGLFDGAPDGTGSTADLAKTLALPVVLIVDTKAMSQSVAALVAGFARHDSQVSVAGIILNRVGSDRHRTMLETALAPLGIPVLGAIPRTDALARPSRHLGLVQAGEMPDLEGFLNTAADLMSRHIDLAALRGLMRPLQAADRGIAPVQRAPSTIAVARDAAFSFLYPHQLADWQAKGHRVRFFSPLADDPVPEASRIFLPGGYPELFAAQLAANQNFIQSLKIASQNTDIYGECGGYMTLGEVLIDADGASHKMAGLLGLTTSFATRKLHLGYRKLQGLTDQPNLEQAYAAHEFHYASTIDAQGTPLFAAQDAEGCDLGQIGLSEGRVAGSFAHII
ncbi:MAG: cobyrinate a,c-diamide synthase, partial [Octadecabacter sp.]|nr:cobyrinate a,c-diamide synthase [Octadecabacter sp.]